MGLMLCAFVVIVTVWIRNRWKARAYFKLAYNAPSNKWHTLLGCGKIMRPKDLLTNTFEYAKKYGPNSVFWLGQNPCFLTTDPQTLKEILTSRNCVDKPMELYNCVVSVCGQGLFTENDPIWSQHRKLLNKAFSNKNLISFLPAFNAEITQLIDKLEKGVDEGEELDILPILRVVSLKNATKTTLKRNLDLTKLNSSTMSIHFEKILQFVADICFYKIMDINWIRKLAEAHIYKSAKEGVGMFVKLVDESLNMAQKNYAADSSYLPKEKSIMDYVLDGSQENVLNADAKHGILIQFFVAAFETTSTILYFALTLLAMHPEHQQRAYEEVSKILTNNDAELSINHLDQLVYLEMIFNETMRVLPAVPMVFRKVSNQDFTLSNGLILPIGQIISIDIFRLHRSKELWGPEAETFNPYNFLPSNVASRHPYSFIPFTKGQRNCIGWRYGTLFFKMGLANLIAKFKFSTDFKYENLRFENHITLKLVEEPRIQLEKRKA